jgi:predicted MFS family arabinose efflux permease
MLPKSGTGTSIEMEEQQTSWVGVARLLWRNLRGIPHRAKNSFRDVFGLLPESWNPRDIFEVFHRDAFMSNMAVVVFLYYVSVWATVSTLMIYVTRKLHFDTITVGWLLSWYGLATMFSEAILIRIIVPRIGEVASIRVGLVAFAIQALIVAFSTKPEHIFFSVFFSMITNLVYPSCSALVSKIVEEDEQGSALGALNGIKAVTEGFGPLLFSGLMSLFEDTDLPGAPYILAAIISIWALLHSMELPFNAELLVTKHTAMKRGDTEASSLLGGD